MIANSEHLNYKVLRIRTRLVLYGPYEFDILFVVLAMGCGDVKDLADEPILSGVFRFFFYRGTHTGRGGGCGVVLFGLRLAFLWGNVYGSKG